MLCRLQTHLQESANQGGITNLLEDEHGKLVQSLTSWVNVLSASGAALRDLPTSLKTDESMNQLLSELESLSPLEKAPTSAVAGEKAFLATATKPGTMCALAIQLGTCEFFYCQSVCFADSHAQIVHVLREAKVVAPSPPLPLASPPASSSNGNGASSAATADMLESRFACLRVQVDNQVRSVFRFLLNPSSNCVAFAALCRFHDSLYLT